MAKQTQYPKKVDELPPGEFYAILKPTSTTVPGDERSRTYPGHGYPEHSVDSWDIEVFTDHTAWEAEIRRLSAQTGYFREPFKAVIMKPVSVRTQIMIDIEPEPEKP